MSRRVHDIPKVNASLYEIGPLLLRTSNGPYYLGDN